MHVELVTTLCRFAELKDDWNRLAGDLPMRSWEWAYTWAETMMGNGQLMLLAGTDCTEKIVAIAPFYRRAQWGFGDVVRFLGDGDCCTDYTTFLAEPEHANTFVDLVAKWMAEHSAGHKLTEVDLLVGDQSEWLGWDFMKLDGAKASDPVVQRFVEKITANNCLAKTTHCETSWQVNLPDSWDDYVASLSKKQRRNVRLVQRRLLEADDVAIRYATDRTSLDFAMKWFRELHQRRWERAGQPGCFADPAFDRFLTLIAERMHKTDQLRMLWIEKAGLPIAVDFTFLSATTSFGYQMGVDPDYHNQEIGRALLVAAIQSTHGSGRRTFDFLRGDESYKSRWGATACPLMNIEIVADRSLPQLRSSLLDLGRKTKRRLLGAR